MKAIVFKAYDRCGKDTAALEICKLLNKYGHTCSIVRLADPLKQVATKAMNIPIQLLEKMKNDNILVGCGMTIATTREVIINIAEAIKDVFGSEIFVQESIERAKQLGAEYVIFPDARYLVEFETLRHSTEFDDVWVIEINSDLDTCGANNIRYEIDKIKPDYVVRNKKNYRGVLREDLEKVLGEILP